MYKSEEKYFLFKQDSHSGKQAKYHLPIKKLVENSLNNFSFKGF